MSKLYNTLEQIRRNETITVGGNGSTLAPSGHVSTAGTVKTMLLIGAGMLLIALAGFYLTPKFAAMINKNQPKPINASEIVRNSQPGVVSPKAAPVSTANDALALNRQAMKQISNDRHWEGIALLLKANRDAPGQIEPLINLGVAFSELGLYAPANRYFSLAFGLEPGHKVLRKNMAILRDAGLLEKPLSFYFATGEMEAGEP